MRTEQIAFVQGDDYAESDRILDEHGDDALFRHLIEEYSGDGNPREIRITGRAPWGDEDTVVWYTEDGTRSPHRLPAGYALTYNLRKGYAGLVQVHEGWPYEDAYGRTLWACCESSIGPTCQHMRGESDGS